MLSRGELVKQGNPTDVGLTVIWLLPSPCFLIPTLWLLGNAVKTLLILQSDSPLSAVNCCSLYIPRRSWLAASRPHCCGSAGRQLQDVSTTLWCFCHYAFLAHFFLFSFCLSWLQFTVTLRKNEWKRMVTKAFWTVILILNELTTPLGRSVRPYFYPLICPLFCLPVYQSVYLSIVLSVVLSLVCCSLCFSLSMFFYLSVVLSFFTHWCPLFCLSIYQSMS